MADTEHRQSVPTEKGKEFQKALLDSHEKKIKSSCFMLKDTLSKLEQLPASLKALETEESNLNTVFQRFEKISNEYLDFLSRCPLENAQDYTEQHWPIFQELKSKVCKLVDRIQLAKDTCDTESSKSRQTRRSIKTDNSNASQLALQTQAKVESEKVKLKFLEKELTLKKEKFDKECEIKVLEQLKTVAAAEAEASVINERPSQADKNEFEAELPKETITPFEKTLNFLRDVSYTKAENDNKLSAEAPVFYPTSTPHVKQQARHTSTLPHTFDRGDQNVVDPSNYLLKKNLLLESMQRQLFDDKPELYLVWKAQFLRMTTEINCSPLEEITLLTSCINRNANAYRLVMSARASCTDQPENCLDLIWTRLDQRFGSPELIESVLKSRIMKLPDSLDYQRLYELSDLLVEIQAVKVLPAYSSIFAYLDSSLGLKQIIQKLPRHIQDKWINRVVNYKKQHSVLYPPFEEFVDFISEISSIRNDPGLNFGSSKEDTNFRGKTQLSNNMKLKQVASHKTEVVTKAGNDKLLCFIHPGSKHTINQCNAFRGKSFHDRREILKSKNVCYRCCETTSHFAKKCEAKIQCNVCKSDRHCTALHISQESTKLKQDFPSAQIHGEEVTGTVLVKTKCTEVCGKFRGKSCARIVPVRVYKKGQSDNFVDCFAMLDDQSNKSLGKGTLFDSLGIHSNLVQYTMQSCSGTCVTNGRLADELVLEGSDNVQIHLPPVLECDNLPENETEIPTSNVAQHFPHMQDIAQYLPDSSTNKEILLLIGRDLPKAHHVIDQRIGSPELPFAQRSPLGWTIIGDVCLSGKHVSSTKVYKTFISKSGLISTLEPCQQVVNISDGDLSKRKTRVTHLDIFETRNDDNTPGLSTEDRQFLEVMDKEFHIGTEGKWTAPLPFRANKEPIPDNFDLALNRARSLDYSLRKNVKKKEHFMTFMEQIFDRNHAELAPEIPPDKERWYLPLFGVYHPHKLDRIRGVFDSSATYQGISLNSQLLQGPDLINSLLGILIRFRKEMIAVVADIEQMFHSFLVNKQDRDYLRFLWHKDNIFDNPLVPYRMRAHVFGNSPSPSIAMYGLRRIGGLAEETHGSDVKDFIINHFYVDDGLVSCSTADEAIDLVSRTQDAMKVHGQLRLHKFASNSGEVMSSFKSEDIAKGLVNLDFEKDTLTQRSLGLLWDLGSDTFKISISTDEKPATRRGILSVVNSLFDPLGFISPVTISGKIILRKMVAITVDWDEPLNKDQLQEWYKWKENLHYLESLQIPRVIVPYLSETVSRELLTYCDASELAISAVSYLHVTYRNNSTKVGFVLGKSKVAPRSGHTIPRLELCAAVLAIEVSQIAIHQLQLELDQVKFFSDSRVVLGYINNNQRRFFIYVGNRVAHIRKLSDPSQWFYVRSEENPADVGTRGINPIDMQHSTWLCGPKLVNSDQDTHCLINPDKDSEIRCNKVDIKGDVTDPVQGFNDDLYSRFSDWDRLVRSLVTIRKFIQKHKDEHSGKCNDIDLIRSTECVIIMDIQRKFFSTEIENLKLSKSIDKNGKIYQLDPYLNKDGLLCVGGRLRKASGLEGQLKHPIILPGKHPATTLIVRKFHIEVKHQGRHMTEGRVRSAGYWILGGKKLVSSIIFKCVTCRKLRSEPSSQKMSDLPEERLSYGEPPFSYVGVDIFGPFEVVTRRTRGGSANSKRWGALFTCLTTRATHIEVVEEMTTSSFVNALRRFTSIRGSVKVIRSDKGTNFVGTVNELRLNCINVDDTHMRKYLNTQGTTWIFNSPHSSHMGGVWERMIAITRRIFESMMLEYGSRNLSHEVLTTFFAEASAIMNSRPFIPISTDPENPCVLSPSMILTQKSPVLPSVVDGMDNSADVDYDMKVDRVSLFRKQWERVKHLSAIFWKRWKVEYINTLQKRRKWNLEVENIKLGDVVLVRDKELSRSAWPMGLIVKSIPSDDGLVRKVVVRVVVNGEAKTYTRPIHEVILLLPE